MCEAVVEKENIDEALREALVLKDQLEEAIIKVQMLYSEVSRLLGEDEELEENEIDAYNFTKNRE